MPTGKPHPINRSTIITHGGITARIDEHAARNGQSLVAVLERLRRGWTLNKAFAYGKAKPMPDQLTDEQLRMAVRADVKPHQIAARLAQGWPIHEACSVPMHGSALRDINAARRKVREITGEIK
jgi:hypothetical protein